MTAAAMVAEFDDVAGWTADAVRRLGDRHAIPAACRGSASPTALAWLAEACELSVGMRLLDVGAGVGGPAAWAAERFGVSPILLEPMPAACRAASTLFGLPVVLADGQKIPLRTASVDVAWCLGVLCTVEDKAGLLSEMHRVLVPGGSLGPEALEMFLRIERPAPPGAPAEGDNYETIGQFYDAIEQRTAVSLRRGWARQAVFSGDPARQVTNAHFRHSAGRLIAVDSLRSAALGARGDRRAGRGYGAWRSLGRRPRTCSTRTATRSPTTTVSRSSNSAAVPAWRHPTSGPPANRSASTRTASTRCGRTRA